MKVPCNFSARSWQTLPERAAILDTVGGILLAILVNFSSKNLVQQYPGQCGRGPSDPKA
jgi:hypothetical protein